MHFDDRERKRRAEEETFDESMYDDDAGGVQSAGDDDERRKRFASDGSVISVIYSIAEETADCEIEVRRLCAAMETAASALAAIRTQ